MAVLVASLLTSCSVPRPDAAGSHAAGESSEHATVPTQRAELLGSDKSWGNTEGPATDSKGALYFTSRGTWKGIVRWTAESGFQQYLAVATGRWPMDR
jgi:hypothetical protein